MLLACLWLFLASSPGFAAPAASVLIRFDNPKAFSEFRIDDLDEYQTAKAFAAEMSKAVVPILAKKAPGGTLSVTFTDVDLGRNWRPVRMSFNYRLQDNSGRILAEGATGITDTSNPLLYTERSLPYRQFYTGRVAMERWVRSLNPAPAYTEK